MMGFSAREADAATSPHRIGNDGIFMLVSLPSRVIAPSGGGGTGGRLDS
jgi:hypothetical protein